MVGARSWGRENGELLLNGDRVSALQDDKVLEMDGSDGCTIQMGLMPKTTLKSSENVPLYVNNIPQAQIPKVPAASAMLDWLCQGGHKGASLHPHAQTPNFSAVCSLS